MTLNEKSSNREGALTTPYRIDIAVRNLYAHFGRPEHQATLVTKKLRRLLRLDRKELDRTHAAVSGHLQKSSLTPSQLMRRHTPPS